MREKGIFLKILLFIFVLEYAKCYKVEKFSFLMPNVRPDVPELYLCTPVKIDTNGTYYIVGFEPNATMNTAHHIIIYGCGKPGSSKDIWNCGEMAEHGDSKLAVAPPCEEESEIIYAWARDAPTLILPEGVGFKIGKKSDLKYLVLQVHYAHVHQFEDGRTDDSGIILHYTKKPLNKLAGVYVMGTGGMIAPHSETRMETACTMDEKKIIHPFAYRTHTHSLGKVVSGYVIKDGKWIELGKRDPLTPQMFYKTHFNGTINPGDILAARCTMYSQRDRWTYIGNTNNDEMCNFYLMYYIESNEPLYGKFCFSYGPPKYYWRKDDQVVDYLTDSIDKEASNL